MKLQGIEGLAQQQNLNQRSNVTRIALMWQQRKDSMVGAFYKCGIWVKINHCPRGPLGRQSFYFLSYFQPYQMVHAEARKL